MPGIGDSMVYRTDRILAMGSLVGDTEKTDDRRRKRHPGRLEATGRRGSTVSPYHRGLSARG